MDILNLLKDKKEVISFLLQTIESNAKMSTGLRSMMQKNVSNDVKTQKLIEVVANQSIQIKHLSLLLLIYTQGSNFDSDTATMMMKMGRGEEALQQMFKNKMEG